LCRQLQFLTANYAILLRKARAVVNIFVNNFAKAIRLRHTTASRCGLMAYDLDSNSLHPESVFPAHRIAVVGGELQAGHIHSAESDSRISRRLGRDRRQH
jgi:hypothetical protein